MANSAILKLLCAILLCIMVAALQAEAAINCNGQGPTAACCTGVRTLKTLANTTQDRQTACRCMKSAATAFPGIDPKNTAALPSKCGVSLPGSVGPQTDCSHVN
ncbi:IWF1': Non-specific lipid-transfer protein [Bienertia sinuspersici]